MRLALFTLWLFDMYFQFALSFGFRLFVLFSLHVFSFASWLGFFRCYCCCCLKICLVWLKWSEMICLAVRWFLFGISINHVKLVIFTLWDFCVNTKKKNSSSHVLDFMICHIECDSNEIRHRYDNISIKKIQTKWEVEIKNKQNLLCVTSQLLLPSYFYSAVTEIEHHCKENKFNTCTS